jgi:WD40 repeat protein
LELTIIKALETGQLLEVLTGHADLISGLATFENSLCSVALDKTLKFWNILEGNCIETVQLLNEGLDVKYR